MLAFKAKINQNKPSHMLPSDHIAERHPHRSKELSIQRIFLSRNENFHLKKIIYFMISFSLYRNGCYK